MTFFHPRFVFAFALISLHLVTGCKIATTTSRDKLSRQDGKVPPKVLDNPNDKELELTEGDVGSAVPGQLVTYCPKDTLPTSSPEEKKWRDAFSLEVMERICNRDPAVAKFRIDLKDWMKSKHLETSWANGINLLVQQRKQPCLLQNSLGPEGLSQIALM